MPSEIGFASGELTAPSAPNGSSIGYATVTLIAPEPPAGWASSMIGFATSSFAAPGTAIRWWAPPTGPWLPADLRFWDAALGQWVDNPPSL